MTDPDPMAPLVPALVICAALAVAWVRQWRAGRDDDHRDPPAGRPW